MNPLQELYAQGQSFWLDYIQRSLLTSGELARMVKEEGLRGMTSNPTIFQKALFSGAEYDGLLKKAAKNAKSSYEIFEQIAVRDIRMAADVLRPVYNSSDGRDGFVSLEVNPRLAYDTAGTIKEAKKLFRLVRRPNVMIKVPGTAEGLPAVEELLWSGVNVNVTLLFSVEVYKNVLECFLSALECRLDEGLSIKKLASVASFFVSRVDTVIDKKLDELIATDGMKRETAQRLLHKAAIANAKLAYEHYLEVVQSPRFLKLKSNGAQVQRLLWASTGTKDKRLSDVVYVEELIGLDTVNTMPPQTAKAFLDHGKVKNTLSAGFEDARFVMESLSGLGININEVTAFLEKQGVDLFVDSFDALLQVVGTKKELLLGNLEEKMSFSLGGFQKEFTEALNRAREEKWMERIWNKDATFWKLEEDHQKIIKNALGWLNVMGKVKAKIPLIEEIVGDVKKGRFTHALLLGMGGSSLAPEVLRLTFGRMARYPDFAILDSTEPASVLNRAKRSKPEKTLFIVSSKSGSTTEPNTFLATFYDAVSKVKEKKAGENFIAITDPGTSMEKVAKEKNFRHIVLNPPDIGGRFSAMSFFGMVPASIMGIDVPKLLARASQMAAISSPYMPLEKNPAFLLGAALGVLARGGKDKVTFVLSPEIGTFGTWMEQLIAESTGKEGTGILPVESEELLDSEFYGEDRVFVHIRSAKDRDAAVLKKLSALEGKGHPVIRLQIEDKFDIAGEIFRWEMATAVAGAILRINPFDQPNVQEAKDLTKSALSQYKQLGKFVQESPVYKGEDVVVYASYGLGRQPSFSEALQKHLLQISTGDYFAILAYIERNSKNESRLQFLRTAVQKWKRVATTVGFGPRFLHSTGQLHKGGKNNGLYLSLTADDESDLPIPGETFGFSVLKEAQARGDWEALKNKNRRVLHIHFHGLEKGLALLKDTLEDLIRG